MQKLVYRLNDDVLKLMEDEYKEAAMFVGKNGKTIQKIINDGQITMAEKWVHRSLAPMLSRQTIRAYEDSLKEV